MLRIRRTAAMSGACCARRPTGIPSVLLSGGVLLLLPKCPLCVAAWLTLVTGVSISTTGVTVVKGVIVAVGIVVWGQLLRKHLAPPTPQTIPR